MTNTPSPGVERQAIIDLDALRHNVQHIADIARPARIMAVVKADGYGHGAVPCARAAVEAGAAWLGVAHITEALELRAAGLEVPILAWLHTPSSQFRDAVEAGIDLGVSGWELEHVVAAARELQRPARVHLKIDTGLGRNGCPPEKWEELVSSAMEHQEEGLLRVVGIFSHFAVADEPEREETDLQIDRFREAVAVAEDAGVDAEVRHIANTPATLSRPDSHFDLVRVGVGIFGLSPFAGQKPVELGLRPVMTLKATVAGCKEVPAGQGVSYGLRYTTTEPTTLALVPLGYADGVPRASDGGPVVIGGKRYRVCGRIAMDQLVVDLEAAHLDASVLGHEAVLFGSGGEDPGADDWADAANTINYEIVARIGARVPRVYLGGPA